MTVLARDIDATFLTERQVDVLRLRARNRTQREIAEELGTSVPNISSIERAARDNIEAAHRTVDLAAVIRSAEQLEVSEGTDLRSIIDEVYTIGDETGLRIQYAEPELSGVLHEFLSPVLEHRRVTRDVWIGITGDGDIVTFPSAASPRNVNQDQLD